jgi:hypothetical protein
MEPLCKLEILTISRTRDEYEKDENVQGELKLVFANILFNGFLEVENLSPFSKQDPVIFVLDGKPSEGEQTRYNAFGT